jgi:hypothetical protein
MKGCHLTIVNTMALTLDASSQHSHYSWPIHSQLKAVVVLFQIMGNSGRWGEQQYRLYAHEVAG